MFHTHTRTCMNTLTYRYIFISYFVSTYFIFPQKEKPLTVFFSVMLIIPFPIQIIDNKSVFKYIYGNALASSSMCVTQGRVSNINY